MEPIEPEKRATAKWRSCHLQGLLALRTSCASTSRLCGRCAGARRESLTEDRCILLLRACGLILLCEWRPLGGDYSIAVRLKIAHRAAFRLLLQVGNTILDAARAGSYELLRYQKFQHSHINDMKCMK